MFMCQNDNDMTTKHNNKDAEFAIPTLSRIQSGAMRSDICIIKHYGGIYVDSDVSSLAKKFPIDVHDSAVSGVACWSH